MKFVILSSAVIPGFNGQRGPLLTPQELDVKSVLKMVGCGIDVREVMPDGSYRKVEFSDDRLTNYLSNKIIQKQEKEMKIEEKAKDIKIQETKTEIKEFNNYKNRDKKKFNNNKKDEKTKKS